MSFPFILIIDPNHEVVFSSEKLGEEPTTALMKITNSTGDHYAFKVKCTSNDIFRIRPPMGLLAPNATITVKVFFY